jgi:hypothetical protein
MAGVTNLGADKDSDKRQQRAIKAFAKSAGSAIEDVDYFYDPAVTG